ncbi:unnamed protein product [Paramecium pentaurelia]|uniref:APCDD1 domain-containing protein n=1 Tax=Paramecium pentaurelia TaxID=43138 RepID=A0A8S1XMS3_9CILI|nr:unnamed protein product [Paramecium pentaurelia]
MESISKAYLIFLLLGCLMTQTNQMTLDEIKDQIVNDWKSLALELNPFEQGGQIFPTYVRRQWNFTSDSEFSMKIEIFNDHSGSNRRQTYEGSGIITYQGESSAIQGAFLCQFNLNKTLILTLHTDEVVTQFNQIQTEGITWIKDKPQDITLLAVPAFNKLAGQPLVVYDLIYFHDNYLYMGEVDAFGNMASLEQPPQGICPPLIPFSDDTTPLTLEELKEEMVTGVWSSIAKEVRPGFDNQGQVITIYITRELSFPDDSSFDLIINRFPGPGQTESLLDFEMIGSLIWEGDASSVVPGAQFTQFVVNEVYLTPKSEAIVSAFNQNLPAGVDPFQLNQRANLTQKDFPGLGLSKDEQVKENDIIYMRQNRLYLGARPVDGSRPYPIEKRTYSLSDDLVDPERSASKGVIILLSLIIFSVWI